MLGFIPFNQFAHSLPPPLTCLLCKFLCGGTERYQRERIRSGRLISYG